MSEPIPESVPTSADPRSRRPVKKARGPETAASKQASQLEALFARPDREIQLPTGPKQRTLAAPPEIVTNVQGSSAGAGSGEFHVYKASRRREYERLRLMDEETKEEEADKEFAAKREEMKKRDEEKTSRNRARRQKKKKEKQSKKMDANGQEQSAGADGDEEGQPAIRPLRPLEPSKEATEEHYSMGGEVKNIDEIGLMIHDDD